MPLVGALCIVAEEIGVVIGLHGLDAVVGLLAAHDTKALIQLDEVQALDEAVGLGPTDFGGGVLDLHKPDGELVEVAIGSAAELAPVVRQHGGDSGAVGLEGGQHIVFHWVTRPPGRAD